MESGTLMHAAQSTIYNIQNMPAVGCSKRRARPHLVLPPLRLQALPQQPELAALARRLGLRPPAGRIGRACGVPQRWGRLTAAQRWGRRCTLPRTGWAGTRPHGRRCAATVRMQLRADRLCDGHSGMSSRPHDPSFGCAAAMRARELRRRRAAASARRT